MIRLSLLGDDTLELALEPELYPLAERWIPHGLREVVLRPPSPEGRGGQGVRTTITVRASRAVLPRPVGRPTLTLGRSVLTSDEGDNSGVQVLRGGLASSGGELNLASGEARLYVDPTETRAAAVDLYSMLTISAGLLLAGQERALVHAAAVVDHAGGAWVLAGDARAGKSTTCATLIAAGWGYLSDDQVVLGLREDEVQAQGWLRPFHLDVVPPLHVVERGTGGEDQERGTGGEDDIVETGDEGQASRREVSPVEVGLASWRRTAPLAGVIFPVVAPSQPTELQPISAAEALAGLVRQSPWLLASPRTAPSMLRLFERAVAGGGFRLRLGLDTYRGPDRLAACLEGLDVPFHIARPSGSC